MSRRIDMFRVSVCEESVENAVKVLRSGYIGEGPMVKKLEAEYCKVSATPFCLAVNSGTSALHLAVLLAGVGTGDEVITTAQTMMATSHAILMARGIPVFADVQPFTGNIDPNDIEHRITPRTKAILVVHWAGYPCDMDEILAIAERHGLVVIEDAAHAIGATYKGRPIGSISPMTCFSLQAIKHVTGGDGGVLALADEKLRQKGARLRWFGIDRDLRKASILGEPEWNVTELGYKYQMNDIAAAVALGNIGHLEKMLVHRRKIAAEYREGLADVPGLALLENRPDRESAYWLFTILVQRRENFLRRLKELGINASVVHLRIDRNDLYGGERRDLPNLDRFTERHVSLPVHEGISVEDVHYIIESIRRGW